VNQDQNNANATIITRRIGSTTYKLKIYFNENTKETMEDKILRMIQNEVLKKDSPCGIMESPQMSRPA
jgi:hypothetical protein